MTRRITTTALTPEAFAPFGEVIEATGDPDKLINQGRCGRFSDRADVDVYRGRTGVSLFKSELCSLPYSLEMVERHPHGSQCFIPMSMDGFMVIAATTEDDRPGRPQAFITRPGQGVNIHRNTWHGVLTPLSGPGLFAVIDRIGDGLNCEEHWFEEAYTVVAS